MVGDVSRHIERAGIDEAILRKPEIVNVANTLELVCGGHQINTTIEHWKITHEASASAFGMRYEVNQTGTSFVFSINDHDGELFLENYHRQGGGKIREGYDVRYFGSGTAAFAELEHIVALLAIKMNKAVTLVFPYYGQWDTKKLLESRGYEEIIYTGILAKNNRSLKRTFYPGVS